MMQAKKRESFRALEVKPTTTIAQLEAEGFEISVASTSDNVKAEWHRVKPGQVILITPQGSMSVLPMESFKRDFVSPLNEDEDLGI